MPRALCSAWACAVLLVAGCSQDAPPTTMLLTGVDLPARLIRDVGPGRVSVEWQRSYGASQGPAALGVIGAVAADDAGRLIVFDVSACQLVVFDWKSAGKKAPVRLGGCGDGPGEFRHVRNIALLGDTLAVVPVSGNYVQFVTLDGLEMGRLHFEALLGAGESVQELEALGGTTFALSVAHPPNAATLRSPDEPVTSLRIVDLADGRVLAAAVGQSPIAQANPGNHTEGPELCVWTGASGRRFAALQNRWSIEGVAFNVPDLTPVLHVVLPGAADPVPFPPPMAGYFPAGLGSSVACTGFGPLFWHREGHVVERRAVTTGGRYALVSWDARELLSTAFGPADSVWWGKPVAGTSDRVFTVDNRTFEFPVVHEFLIRAGPSDEPNAQGSN